MSQPKPPNPNLLKEIGQAVNQFLTGATARPAAPLASPAPTVPVPAQIDFGGKLDALLAEQQSTNALLTALLDQMAAQQFQTRAVGQAQPLPATSETLAAPTFRGPFLYHNKETGKWYKALYLMQNTIPAGPITILATTTLNLSQPPAQLTSPLLVVLARFVGITATNGLVEVDCRLNSIPLGTQLRDVLTIPLAVDAGVLVYPGIQDFNLLQLGTPLFMEGSFKLDLRVRNYSAAPQTVALVLGFLRLEELLDPASYLQP